MPIVNESSELYLPPSGEADAAVHFGLILTGDFAAEVYNPFVDASFDALILLTADFQAQSYNPVVDAEFDADLILSAEFLAEAVTPGDDNFQSNLILTADFECDTALALVEPEPLLREISANAFVDQNYASGGGRLFINNVQTDFVSAEISAPTGSIGKTLAIELARADLAQLPANASFKFEIGKNVDGSVVWETIVDGAKLASRNYRMSTGRDALSISIKSADSKLDRCPKNNLIVYDRAKAEVSVDEMEPLYTNTNEVILTTARPVNVLTLKKLLHVAFVEGCGFASVETDIPNYEIARCDFSITNSYASSVAQFVGMYEPDYVVENNNLLIQKTINPHPAGYTPNPLHAARYPNFTEAQDFALNSIDGYVLQYTAAGTRHVDRNLPTATEPVSGKFGDADFVETTIQRKMRDWFETGNPTAVRSELKKEIRETRRGGILIGRETKENTFDRLGRGTGYTNTSEARMPDVAQNNQPSLLKVREETQRINYKTNPFAPRQTVTSKVQTSFSALLAIDSENTALDRNGEDSPYGQDYERVFEAGNLQSGMTAEFRTLETVTDHFRPQASGQIEVRTERYDALRGKMKPSQPSETKSGDISVGNFQKQQTKAIFKAGVTQANRTGGEMRTVNTGELPLFFAEPLTVWLLANPPVTGSIEVIGYDKSLERGVSFNLRGRAGEDLGNFKTRGYVVSITPKLIMTRVEALKV